MGKILKFLLICGLIIPFYGCHGSSGGGTDADDDDDEDDVEIGPFIKIGRVDTKYLGLDGGYGADLIGFFLDSKSDIIYTFGGLDGNGSDASRKTATFDMDRLDGDNFKLLENHPLQDELASAVLFKADHLYALFGMIHPYFTNSTYVNKEVWQYESGYWLSDAIQNYGAYDIRPMVFVYKNRLYRILPNQTKTSHRGDHDASIEIYDSGANTWDEVSCPDLPDIMPDEGGQIIITSDQSEFLVYGAKSEDASGSFTSDPLVYVYHIDSLNSGDADIKLIREHNPSVSIQDMGRRICVDGSRDDYHTIKGFVWYYDTNTLSSRPDITGDYANDEIGEFAISNQAVPDEDGYTYLLNGKGEIWKYMPSR